jgi:hypothetical protein
VAVGSDTQTANERSATILLGWVSVGLGLASVLGTLAFGGSGWDEEGSRTHEAILIVVLPTFIGPAPASARSALPSGKAS